MSKFTSRAAEQLLSRLEKVRSSGSGWTARCPAHDDDTPSLSVSVGRDGRTLVKCHGGSACTAAEVAAAVGLTLRDLFDDAPSRPFLPPPPIRKARSPAANAKGRDTLGKLVRVYDYVDADGALVFQVCRFNPKDFRQRQPKQNGGWQWNLRGIEPVLYHLPALIEAIALGRTVYLVEGEKDAECLHHLGAIATTAPGGASRGQGKWRPSYTVTLTGAHVVYLPDNDAAGRGQSVRIANELVTSAASVTIVPLPGLPLKGDVSDFIANGGTLADIEAATQTTAPVKPAVRWPIASTWKRP